MKFKLFLIAVAVQMIVGNSSLAQIAPPPGGRGDGINPGQVTIHWPSPTSEYPTLQSAVDGLPDEGGIIKISAGRHVIREPVIIASGGNIVIQGRGCNELSRWGMSDYRRLSTHLQGPSTRRVAAFDEAVGLFNLLDGSLTLRDLKLSGFDAGVVHKVAVMGDGTGGRGDVEELAPPLTIRSVCMTNTGRGIVSMAPGALIVEQVLIRDVLWNGVSINVPPTPQPFKFSQSFNSLELLIFQAQNACVVIKNAHAYFNGLRCNGVGGNSGNYGFGDGGGIYVENSVITLNSVHVYNSSRPGIIVNGGVTSITGHSVIKNTEGFGLLIYKPISAYVNGIKIENTDAFSSGFLAGTFGDGLSVVGRATGSPSFGLVQVLNVPIGDSDRAALSNFGGIAALQNNNFKCAAFELENEPFLGNPGVFIDWDDNNCECAPEPAVECVAVSVGLAPPGPISSHN